MQMAAPTPQAAGRLFTVGLDVARRSSGLHCSRTETDGTLTVRQRVTGVLGDAVFCTAADSLEASYNEPLNIELNSM
jgi:hypothetical protein